MTSSAKSSEFFLKNLMIDLYHVSAGITSFVVEFADDGVHVDIGVGALSVHAAHLVEEPLGE